MFASFYGQNFRTLKLHCGSIRKTQATWEQFRILVLNEFLQSYHTRRARYILRRSKQTSSVSKYVAEFHNCILIINDMYEGKESNTFVQKLKYNVKLDPMMWALKSEHLILRKQPGLRLGLTEHYGHLPRLNLQLSRLRTRMNTWKYEICSVAFGKLWEGLIIVLLI